MTEEILRHGAAGFGIPAGSEPIECRHLPRPGLAHRRRQPRPGTVAVYHD